MASASGTFTAAQQVSDRLLLRVGEQVRLTLTPTGGTWKVSLVAALGNPPAGYAPLFEFSSAQTGYYYRNTTDAIQLLALKCEAVSGGTVAYTIADVVGDQVLREDPRGGWYAADSALVAKMTDRGLVTAVDPLTGAVNADADGAVGDGTTDDSTAFAIAFDRAQARGLALVIPFGRNYRIVTWATPTCTSALRIFGGGTVTWAGDTNKAFAKCPVNVDLSDVTFDGWSRVVDNETGVVTTAIDHVRARLCTFKNATAVSSNFCQQLLVQNEFEEVTVEDCRFENCVYTTVQTGDNVYADQDKWKRVNFNRNRVLDVDMIGTTAAIGYGVLIYGMDVSVNGNDIEDVDGPTAAASSASNGASGIYTKARYNQIIGNRVKRIGVNTACASADGSVGIHIKGADRSVTSSPQGFDVACTGNVVRTVGVSNSYGYGIAALHSDVNVSHNIVEEFGTIGVVLADAVTGASGSTLISANIIRQAAGASTIGINAVNASASRVVIEGNALKVPAIGIYVRNVSWNIANVLVERNNLDCGTIAIALSVADGTSVSKVKIRGNLASVCTIGTYFTYGTGTYAGIDVEDNDFSAASTVGISGTGSTIPSGVRIRRNRGFVTENGGTSSGKTTGQTIAHGLAAAPTVFSVVPQAAATDVYVTADATNLTVTFGGGGTVAFAWEAKTAHHYAS